MRNVRSERKYLSYMLVVISISVGLQLLFVFRQRESKQYSWCADICGQACKREERGVGVRQPGLLPHAPHLRHLFCWWLWHGAVGGCGRLHGHQA